MRDADVRGIVEWSRVAVAVAACLLLALPLAAQDEPMGEGAMAQEGAMPEMSPEDQAMMEAYMKAGTPGEPHARMAEHTGDYAMVIKSWMDPSGEPMVSKGTAHSEMVLGGRVHKETVESEMMGTPFTGLGFTGYDNTKGKYWAIWMDSMSTGVAVGEGEWDDEAEALRMTMDYVDPATEETKTVRTVTRWTDDGNTVFEWYEPREGTEVKTMEIVYTPK